MTGHAQLAKFIDRTYGETLQLLEEARDYSVHDWKEESDHLPAIETIQVNKERMRLTARLSVIMAWLMVHKAVSAGEMTPAQAQSDTYHLTAHDVCLPGDSAEELKLPDRLKRLLNRSFELYGRVSKMDRMAQRQFAKGV
ncbi:MAG: DUF1465 family protein [Proteobacteria bacterium]|nr:DUF1465 family protein [Pseudomonadota bacterium]